LLVFSKGHSKVEAFSIIYVFSCWISRIGWICLTVGVLIELKYGKDEQEITDARLQVLAKLLSYYYF
jgi:hypothetical protein